MMTQVKKIVIFQMIGILIFLGIGAKTPILAQDGDSWDNSSQGQGQTWDDSSGEDSDEMFDDEFGDEFDDEFDGESDGSMEDFFGESDINEDGEYLDDSLVPDGAERDLELALLRQKQLLLEEKINAPLNVAYGAGTGLMIGGWLALLSSRTSRQTLRSIGLGVVVGAIIGAVIGTRSVWDPNAPRPEGIAEPLADSNATFIKSPGLTLAFNWSF